MKIAIISDIHANIYALQAVLEDITRQKVDQIYCTGDLVGYAPFPNEVIETIQNQQIPAVMGNYDDAVGNMRFICGCDYKNEAAQALGEESIRWTKEHTSEINKEFLSKLPAKISFKNSGYNVLLVHGSPNKLNEYLYEDLPVEYLNKLMEDSKTDILVCGHTHKPFYKVINGRHLINAGSVGKPKHGSPQATYVIITLGKHINVELRRADYDFEKTAQAIENSSLPNQFAEMIRQGIGW